MNFFSEEQATEVWKARWLGVGVQALVEKYKKSPFRFYEVWTEEKNVGSRNLAWEQFQAEFPDKARQVDPSPHVPRRKVIQIPKPFEGQGDFFR